MLENEPILTGEETSRTMFVDEWENLVTANIARPADLKFVAEDLDDWKIFIDEDGLWLRVKEKEVEGEKVKSVIIFRVSDEEKQQVTPMLK